jgi:hypothetical protein
MNKFGKWYPFNPFPLPKGTKLLHYVFTKEIHDKLPLECIKDTLDRKGFCLPCFVRTNEIGKDKFIEYLTIK